MKEEPAGGRCLRRLFNGRDQWRRVMRDVYISLNIRLFSSVSSSIIPVYSFPIRSPH